MQRYGRAHRLTCIVVQYMATEEGTSRGALALRRYPSSGEMTDEDGVDVCMWSTAVGIRGPVGKIDHVRTTATVKTHLI